MPFAPVEHQSFHFAGFPMPLRINYIEFPAQDVHAARRFYTDAFGWSFQDYGPTYTAFDDGAMKGGFQANAAERPDAPLVVLYTKDLADAKQRILNAGGAITRDIFDFPGGRRFHFTDPEGNALAVWSDQSD